MSDYLIVLTTVEDQAQAEALAGPLLENGLAACINILPPMTSMYTWQGKVQREQEHLLLIKTRRQCYEALREAIHAAHPYEVPEIVAVNIEAGLADYLNWITECTTG